MGCGARVERLDTEGPAPAAEEAWPRRRAKWWRAVRWGATVAGLAYLFASILGLIPFTLQLGVPPGLDTNAYWSANLDNLYSATQIGETGAYLYSPAFAQAFVPLRILPFEVVYALWLALCLGLLAWMRVLWFVALPPVIAELYFGNVHVLYAAIIVAGFRLPGLWALPWLTKVTPGIGSLWFGFRREWRQLATALATTALIAAGSFVLAPDLWLDWLDSLVGNVGRPTGMRTDAIPLWARLAAATVVLAWGALTGRRWTIPVAVFLSAPTIWPGSVAVLAAAFSPLLGSSQPRP
ncbi:MAG: glycosyltransferase 87 family protein [Candidatus Limnocylindria bacterium]